MCLLDWPFILMLRLSLLANWLSQEVIRIRMAGCGEWVHRPFLCRLREWIVCVLLCNIHFYLFIYMYMYIVSLCGAANDRHQAGRDGDPRLYYCPDANMRIQTLRFRFAWPWIHWNSVAWIFFCFIFFLYGEYHGAKRRQEIRWKTKRSESDLVAGAECGDDMGYSQFYYLTVILVNNYFDIYILVLPNTGCADLVRGTLIETIWHANAICVGPIR